MSTPWETDEQEPTQQSQERNPLRDVVKDLEAKYKQSQEEAEKLRTENRSLGLGATVRDLGLDPRIAQLVPTDVDPTKDAVSAWVSNFGDLFGVKAADETTAPQEPQGQTSVPPDVQAQWARVQENQAGSSAPDAESVVLSKLAAANQNNTGGFEGLLKAFQDLGGPQS